VGKRSTGTGTDESLSLDRFIDSLDLLDGTQLSILDAAWHSIDYVRHEHAWGDVRRLARDAEIERLVDAARNRAMRWSNRGSNIPAMPYSLQSEDEWLALRRKAAPALVDAALAITLGDRLPGEARDVLLGPWLRATAMKGR
jgi:hypothetical protein